MYTCKHEIYVNIPAAGQFFPCYRSYCPIIEPHTVILLGTLPSLLTAWLPCKECDKQFDSRGGPLEERAFQRTSANGDVKFMTGVIGYSRMCF